MVETRVAGDPDAEARPPAEVRALYDRAGNPISLERFGQLRRNHQYKIVRRDEVGAAAVVTAWIGTDQGLGLGDEPPQIFGTITFGADGIDLGTETFAASEEQALANHAAQVSAIPSPDREGHPAPTSVAGSARPGGAPVC